MRKKYYLGLVAVLVILIAGLVVFTNSGHELKARLTGSKTDSYTACGCGGCGGAVADEEKTVYSRSEFEKIKHDDQIEQHSPHCASVGCALCTKYTLKL